LWTRGRQQAGKQWGRLRSIKVNGGRCRTIGIGQTKVKETRTILDHADEKTKEEVYGKMLFRELFNEPASPFAPGSNNSGRIIVKVMSF
jgi:hypothetical protein